MVTALHSTGFNRLQSRALQKSCPSTAGGFRCLPMTQVSSRVTKNSVVRQASDIYHSLSPESTAQTCLYELKEGPKITQEYLVFL